MSSRNKNLEQQDCPDCSFLWIFGQPELLAPAVLVHALAVPARAKPFAARVDAHVGEIPKMKRTQRWSLFLEASVFVATNG